MKLKWDEDKRTEEAEGRRGRQREEEEDLKCHGGKRRREGNWKMWMIKA